MYVLLIDCQIKIKDLKNILTIKKKKNGIYKNI